MGRRWVTVVVDDYFPCTQDASGLWQPIFAHSKTHDGGTDLSLLDSLAEGGYDYIILASDGIDNFHRRPAMALPRSHHAT